MMIYFRFNHRQIEMFPPNTFDEYFGIAKELLSPAKVGNVWNNQINHMFKGNELKNTLNRIYNINCSVAYLKQILSLAIISSVEELTADDVAQVCIHIFLKKTRLKTKT